MPYPYEFKDDHIPPSQVLCIRRTTPLPNVELVLRELFVEVAEYLRELDVEPAGAPFACYHSIGPEEIDLEAGFPVDRVIPSRRQIKIVQLEGGPAVSTTHSRPYEPVTYADEALRGWLDKQCMEAVGPLIEIHLADPLQAEGSRRGRIKLIQRVGQAPLTGQSEALQSGLGATEPGNG